MPWESSGARCRQPRSVFRRNRTSECKVRCALLNLAHRARWRPSFNDSVFPVSWAFFGSTVTVSRSFQSGSFRSPEIARARAGVLDDASPDAHPPAANTVATDRNSRRLNEWTDWRLDMVTSSERGAVGMIGSADEINRSVPPVDRSAWRIPMPECRKSVDRDRSPAVCGRERRADGDRGPSDAAPWRANR